MTGATTYRHRLSVDAGDTNPDGETHTYYIVNFVCRYYLRIISEIFKIIASKSRDSMTVQTFNIQSALFLLHVPERKRP